MQAEPASTQSEQHKLSDYFAQASYETSATQFEQCPADSGSEVAFVGRSNAGKSSALNRLCRQKKLAMSSKTPGRTQMLNFFTLPKGERLVDLPGYGYANTAKAKQREWTGLVNDYLKHRQALSGLVLLMDCRHPFKPADWQLIEWSQACDLPVRILLTKADKLSRQQGQKALNECQRTLANTNHSQLSIQLFSSTQPAGLTDCWAFIGQKLNISTI